MGKEIKNKVGIYDANLYYTDGPLIKYLPRTIGTTIDFDERIINIKKKEGFDPRSLKTFLIGGFYSPKSIEAMIKFIQRINPDGGNKTLLAVDLNEKAFSILDKWPIEIPQNILLKRYKADLTKLNLLGNGSVDYVRMDLTQNFISEPMQEKLLKELSRVLSNDGLVCSVIDIVPKATRLPEKIIRKLLPNVGSFIKPVRDAGYNAYIPTVEFLDNAAKKAGFKTSYLFDSDIYTDGKITGFIVYEKPKAFLRKK